jgi:hypothetical protein
VLPKVLIIMVSQEHREEKKAEKGYALRPFAGPLAAVVAQEHDALGLLLGCVVVTGSHKLVG